MTLLAGWVNIYFDKIVIKTIELFRYSCSGLGLFGVSPSLLGGGTLGNPPHNMWIPQSPSWSGEATLTIKVPEEK